VDLGRQNDYGLLQKEFVGMSLIATGVQQNVMDDVIVLDRVLGRSEVVTPKPL